MTELHVHYMIIGGRDSTNEMGQRSNTGSILG